MEKFYFETKKYRCLVEYGHFPTEELYLSMCGVESCLPGKGFGPVVREGYHLHVIISGKGILRVEDREYELRAGQMFIEKPGELTLYRADMELPWSYCWMAFGGACAQSLVASAGFTAGINVLESNVDPLRFFKLADETLSQQELSISGSLRRFGYLNQFLALAVDSAAASPQNRVKQNYLLSGREEYMNYALDFIRRNYAAVSVTDVAAYLGISRSHLTRLFNSSLGCSPGEYIMNLRMQRSAWLLANTAMPIQEISMSIGYEDQLTFSKAFKKVYDVSPKYYREQPPENRKVLRRIQTSPPASDHGEEADAEGQYKIQTEDGAHL